MIIVNKTKQSLFLTYAKRETGGKIVPSNTASDALPVSLVRTSAALKRDWANNRVDVFVNDFEKRHIKVPTSTTKITQGVAKGMWKLLLSTPKSITQKVVEEPVTEVVEEPVTEVVEEPVTEVVVEEPVTEVVEEEPKKSTKKKSNKKKGNKKKTTK